MLKPLIAALFLITSIAAPAQTLFRYGNDSVSVSEFLTAYKKNNTGTRSAKGIQEYMDLYIASRLKIKEAKNKRLDTLPQLVTDLQNLRNQILPGYLNDAESTKRLIAEAFTRSQKDIHIAHIYIPFTVNGQTDTITAAQKAKAAYEKLKRGDPFTAVAKAYSADPSVAVNGGEIGYITVFNLPYELESLAYATPVGAISSLYHSKSGYHIFKNLGERKAWGKIKVAQILLAFPPDADAAAKAVIKRRADSLYNRLEKGDDFEKLATGFSNDIISAASGGKLPAFGIGRYDPLFENAAFSLPKDGALSKPLLTTHGYHIIKRLQRIPVATARDEKTGEAMKTEVENDERILTTNDVVVKRVLAGAGYRKLPFQNAGLWAYTDSALDAKITGVRGTINAQTPLLTISKDTLLVKDWVTFVQPHRYKHDGSGLKKYEDLWDEFVQESALAFYKRHLEEYNESFRTQISEFKEGNLFFEIMQQQVWTPAQSDTAALENYYKEHRSRYNWSRSADAAIFYASDSLTARLLFAGVKASPRNWKGLANNLSEKVAVDSARFELVQIPNGMRQPLTPGLVTAPLLNKGDNTVSLALIFKVYLQPAPRSFAEAKGLVITDYQTELEKQWLTELKKKYPVTINQKAVEGLMAKL